MNNRRLLTASLLAASALTFAAPASAQRIDNIVAFGDSYADDGNAFQLAGINPVSTQIYTTGRFSGGTWGMVVGHVAPEAYAGGTIALIEEGDSITIDAHRLLIQLNVDDATLAARRARWRAPAPRYTRGLLAKYMRLVSTASRGAVTDAVT